MYSEWKTFDWPKLLCMDAEQSTLTEYHIALGIISKDDSTYSEFVWHLHWNLKKKQWRKDGAAMTLTPNETLSCQHCKRACLSRIVPINHVCASGQHPPGDIHNLADKSSSVKSSHDDDLYSQWNFYHFSSFSVCPYSMRETEVNSDPSPLPIACFVHALPLFLLVSSVGVVWAVGE